jgi:hypothetical protein
MDNFNVHKWLREAYLKESIEVKISDLDYEDHIAPYEEGGETKMFRGREYSTPKKEFKIPDVEVGDALMYINHPKRIEEFKKEFLEGFGDGIAVINPDTMNIDIKNDKFEKYREEYRQRKFKSINKYK